ncbi:hypothetical protein [Romboutsia sp. 1001713B170131_170501_G6]|uniref:hypothetical protein n=1 Tax=Romboutsia sp. 1001713B170131_170501_G6 TaxID=2787108 RepID=UPI0018AA9261|nr:hypothetical protein [Romboutsia sp. 1001713B170131_170501_G6]
MYVDLEIIELLDELESMINNASSIPFSQKSGIDKNEVLGVIGEIKSLVPEEVKQATWINKERHKIINDAKIEAQELVEQAKKEAQRIQDEYNEKVEELKKNSDEILNAYLESSEPIQKAELQAKEMIARAERIAGEIRLGSIEYADNVLLSLEHNIKDLLEEVSRDRLELNPEQ